ncbi:MAG: septum formation initiator family protein [bacterium]
MRPKKKRLRLLVGAAGILLILYVFFGGEYNLFKLWNLKQKHNKLLTEVNRLELEQEELSKQIADLNNDLGYIEKIAREKYKMGRQGERIYLMKERDDK